MQTSHQTTRWISPSGEICGLYLHTPGSRITRHYLPQVKLESHTTITSVCYTTTLRQTFENPSSDTVSQARYTFPLYDGVAVSGYTITHGNKTLKGVVQHQETAKNTYDAAIDRGETAGLLESLPAGVFGVTLGNLPAKTDVHVDIVYCGELKHDAAIDGLRYMLPTSIAPRYGVYPGELLKSTAVNQGGVSVVVDVDMSKNAIRKVQSPSHPIAVSLGATSTQDSQVAFDQSKASATLTLRTAELAGDFVLQLMIDDLSKPQAILEEHPDLPSRAVMATFVPRFNLKTSYPEIVFIADQSGSMRGDKNASLVSALKIFLKSLPIGVHFNIIAFGSSFEALWPKSQAYNEGNVRAAVAFVDTLQAQYGGTEILEPVRAAFEQRLGSDMPLEVMMLTDGQIWSEEKLFEYIGSQVGKDGVDARVFALGIGSGVSHTLVEGVARAGHGFAQFVTQGEETDRNVVRMLKGALYPHLKDQTVEISYGGDDEKNDKDDEDFELVEKVDYCLKIQDPSPNSAQQTDAGLKDEDKNNSMSLYDTSADLESPVQAENTDRYAHLPTLTTPKILQAPSQLPSLFPFNRNTIYLLLDTEEASPQRKVTSIIFRATSPQGPLELTIDVDDTKTTTGTTLHQLAARKAIQDLEDGRGWLQTAETDGILLKDSHKTRFDELVEREAVRIGERYQVAGKWTSFVAVEDNGNKKPDDTIRDNNTGSRTLHVSQKTADRTPGTSEVLFLQAGYQPYSSSSSAHQMQFARLAMPPSSMRRSGGMSARYSRGGGSNRSYSRSAAAPTMGAPQGTYMGSSPMPAAATTLGTSPVSPRPAAEKKKRVAYQRLNVPEEKEESDDDMGFGLFDGDDDNASAAITAAVAPPPPAAGKKNALHDLVGLQKFLGAWDWNDELFAIIGKEVTFDADAFSSTKVMATALAVAFLESKLTESRGAWEMVVAKARGWMVSEGVEDAERVVAIAKGLL